MYHLARFLPTLANSMKKLPIPIVRLIHPGAAHMLQSQVEFRKAITSSLRTHNQNLKQHEHEHEPTPHSLSRSVIISALTDPTIPASENTLDRLVDEGMTIILGGTETVAHTLALTMFYVLSNPEILSRLREELTTLAPGHPEKYTYSQLEALPYLTGVIQEGLRLSHGISARLPRISMAERLRYGEWDIPAGVSPSSFFTSPHPPPLFFALCVLLSMILTTM